MDELTGSVMEPGTWCHYFPVFLRAGRQGCHPLWIDTPEVLGMNISKREITVALAHRTKEVILAQKALYAAATIHTATILMLLACFAIPMHAVCA